MTSDSATDPSSPLRRLGYAGPLLDVDAIEWHDGRATRRRTTVVEETPAVIVYNRVPHVVMMATPADLEDFVLGFSLTEELITSPDQLLDVSVERFSLGIEIKATIAPERDAVIAERARQMGGRTGCGICGANDLQGVLKTLHPVVPGRPLTADVVHAAFEELTGQQELNRQAGAVHAAGWASRDGHIVLVREDVGRHNALDKLVGAAITRGVDPADGFVVVTSRASFEMVQKATVLGAPLLAAISGPTGLAVRVAQEAGMTLVGFARRNRLTAYTHPARLVAHG